MNTNAQSICTFSMCDSHLPRDACTPTLVRGDLATTSFQHLSCLTGINVKEGRVIVAVLGVRAAIDDKLILILPSPGWP